MRCRASSPPSTNAATPSARSSSGRKRWRWAGRAPTSTTAWPTRWSSSAGAPRRGSIVRFPAACGASGASGWIRSAKHGNGSPVDPAREAEETLLPPPPPGPGTLGALRPPLLNVFLFLLTFASAFLAGALLNDTQLPNPTRAEQLRHGLGFAL